MSWFKVVTIDMPDYFGLPDNSERQQFFTATGGYVPWLKPRGISMIYFLCISPGGGGGGGFSSGSNTQAGGGGGGASGSVSTLLMPAFSLPDILFVSVFAGTQGAAAGGMSTGPNTGYPNACTVITGSPPCDGSIFANTLISGAPFNNGGSGAFAGTASAGGSAGGTPGSVSYAFNPLAILGITNYTSGLNGAAGNATSTGSNIAFAPAQTTVPFPVTGGAGGAGTTGASSSAGGGIPAGIGGKGLPALTGGAAGSGVNAGDGAGGLSLRGPMSFTGGLGGGSASGLFNGGRGGDGAIGCGGGGGGGGTVGGKGGNGGSGLIVISCW